MATNQFTARFKITGSIYKIGDTQTFTSGFTKREVVVNTNTTRPSPVALVLFKDDCSKADSVKVGDNVTVEGTVNGREWNGPNGTKFFNDLIIRSIMVMGQSEEVKAKPSMPPAPETDNLDPMPF